MRHEYFLDWRPVSAIPALTPVAKPKFLQLTKQELIAEIEAESTGAATKILPPKMWDAFSSARALARRDGVLAIEIAIDPSQPLDIEAEESLDELCQLISWSFKKSMHHTHDVHTGPRLKARPENLSADSALKISPIPLRPSIWGPIFERGSFGDAALKTHALGVPHNALVALRFEYIKLSDRCVQLVDVNRRAQIRWRRKRVNWLFYVLISLVISILLFFLIMGVPHSIEEFIHLATSYKFVLAAILESYLGTIFFVFHRQFRLWDRPRTRFLRSAVNYFHYVNPFNAIAADLCGGDKDKFGDFSNIVNVLKTKLEGEEHRGAIEGMWMSLAVGAAGLLLAAMAVNVATETEIQKTAASYKHFIARSYVIETQEAHAVSLPAHRRPPRRRNDRHCVNVYRSTGDHRYCCADSGCRAAQ